MRKILVVPLIAAVACGGGQLKDQMRDAMPSKDTVSMGSPPSSTATASSGGTIVQNSTVGQNSFFHDLTVGVAIVFNVPTALFLDLLRHVTEDFEPTSCDQAAQSCTWQGHNPLIDKNDYKLVVTKDADGVSFDWTLSGLSLSAPPGSAFIQFASGVATPGAQAHHGSGTFSIDFDKEALLQINGDATGQLQVTHYTNIGPAQLAVTYMGAKDSGTNPGTFNNILYTYANNTTGGGDLDFAVHNTTTQDRFSVHSRWKNDGSGRADVQGTGSNLAVSLSECWGASPFVVAYFSSNITTVIPPWGGPVSGSVTACAYQDASFSSKVAP